MDPESTSTVFPAAPLWRRLAALLYDCFIMAALGLLYATVVTWLASLAGAGVSENYEQTVGGALYQLGFVTTINLYYIWCWHKKGQTIGMKTWHIQAVTLDGEPPPILACCLRAFWGSLLVLCGGIGYWYSFFDRKNACLHDRLSKTQVLHLNR